MFEQIKLGYTFNALEPHIDTTTMETHYQKHHATYTKNFNVLTQNAGISEKPADVILAHWKKKSAGEKSAQGIRNNGGGFFNHNLYFGHMSPLGGGVPAGELGDKIQDEFGSFDSFKEQITKLAIGQFGSGWAWLNTDVKGKLSLSASPNQDNPLLESEGALYPIMSIDVWEHAYYLKYKNLRADYIEAFFEVIDWDIVTNNYKSAISRLKEIS